MAKRKPVEHKQSLTMYEIARLAGVSQSTVSRVLNGSTPVAPDKQAAVLEVIERLNYRPNITAQGLVSGKTSTVGILTRHLGTPFFSEILRGIAGGLQGTNYHPVIGIGGEKVNDDMEALDMLLARRVDGLIIQIGRHVSDEYLREIADQVPMILIGRMVEGIEDQCLVTDNVQGAYLATSYLIEKGHICIAHVTGRLSTVDAIDRQQGYIKALKEHGIAVIPELIVEGDFSEDSGTQALEKLLVRRREHPFTAIFVANDQMAAAIRLELFYRGIEVPDNISLVGFDDLYVAQYLVPPLTTIRQPAYMMGMLAVQALLTQFAGENFVMPTFPTELIIRRSVAMR